MLLGIKENVGEITVKNLMIQGQK